MKTEDLIRALAADPQPRTPPLAHLMAAALLLGAVCAAALFLWRVKARPDFGVVVHEPIFVLKFLVTLALAAASAGLLWRLIRPGAERGPWLLALFAAPALLAGGILYELMVVDPSAWGARLVGRNAMFCLRTIPLLAAPMLVALLFAMRQGAPARPALAGAVAGLVAGGFGAALYAAHCTDDSPLFVAAWYGLAIALVAGAGALIGARWLRW
jgi:hypothetical protein